MELKIPEKIHLIFYDLLSFPLKQFFKNMAISFPSLFFSCCQHIWGCTSYQFTPNYGQKQKALKIE